MPDIQTLKAELDTDPLGRGYAAMTDQQAADDMNLIIRSRNRVSVSGDEVFNAADGAELAALAGGAAGPQRRFQMFLALCGRDSIDPFGAANVALITEIFGGGSATITALNALRVETVSRAEELGFEFMGIGLIENARSL